MRLHLLFKVFVVAFFFCSPVYSQKPDSSSNRVVNRPHYIVDRILLEGNKVTKPAIIMREFTFTEADTIYGDSTALKETLLKCRNNLFNTSLFTTVFVTYDIKPMNHVDVHVKMNERLYTWPVPIFELAERNFNVWWQNKDLTRVNYGFYVSRYNFRGRSETVTLNVQAGYTENFSVSYSIPYINKKRASGLAFNFKYTRNHETPYVTKDNNLVFFKTYSEYIRKIFQTGIRYSYRGGIYNLHRAGMYYNAISIADTIFRLNPDYLAKGGHNQKFITFDYQYDRDCRNVKAYPLKGYYFGVVFGTYQNGKKDPFNTSYVVSAYARYLQLSNRFYFSSALKGKLSTPGRQAYYNQRALGFGNDLVRGYNLYVIDGQYYGLFKNMLKFELVKPQLITASFIPTDKFKTIPFAIYLNLFGDAGYVTDKYYFQNNPLSNQYLFGTGVGLDYVTYYDMVFRMEYAINRFGERGFFLNFNATL